jgi:uncharacterized protein
MGLVFDPVASRPAPAPQRCDVACFIGFVGRRRHRALMPALREQLAAAGWIGGLWAKGEADIEALLGVPLVVDSWHVFDRWYAWDDRPLYPGGSGRCASYLGAAVRSFFARGGRRAVILRVGDPAPLLEGDSARAVSRVERLRALLPADLQTPSPNPAPWRGIQHLLGLPEVSMVLLPDLPDLCGNSPSVPLTDLPVAAVAKESFVECTGDRTAAAATAPERALRRIAPPRLDAPGWALWAEALRSAQTFVARRRPDCGLLASVPLALQGQTEAVTDRLRQIGVLLGPDAPELADAKPGVRDPGAFCQLAWPWLQSPAHADLPGALAPAEGSLAGLVAGTALRLGAFRSAAGDAAQPWLRDVAGSEPEVGWGTGGQTPAEQLSRQVCVLAPSPDGWALQSDVTTSPQEAWRSAGASRLMAALSREVRHLSEAVAFEPNGPALWALVTRQLDDLLQRWWRVGAFSGRSTAEAWSLRCDRSTMTQNDLDQGRLVVQLQLRPAVSIETLTVVFNLATGPTAAALREAA